MKAARQLLSSITTFNKYAKFYPEIKRREVYEEICDRNCAMHVKKYPSLKLEIQKIYRDFVKPQRVMPSMRSMQFGGLPIEMSNQRIFNCAYRPIDSIVAFSECMHLLLGGTGLGYSVQHRHISQMQVIKGPSEKHRKFLIGDSIEGWADAVKVLVSSYANGKSDPTFDYRDIRPKGSRLVTSGGKAPGPDPLRICLDEIRKVLNNSIGRKLTSLECHDIMCHIADAVLSGGIRRAAMICLFDKDDWDMIGCKSGTWWELNPQRGRANNSVMLLRETTTEQEFKTLWERIKESGAGEPGFYWTNNLDWGTNPCVETSLPPYTFCNLTEINGALVTTQEEFNACAKAGAFLGTLQAGYTDYHYLCDEWKDATEDEALIGVGITGIASKALLDLDEREASQAVIVENRRVAQIIGINPAKRCTVVKPSGTTSCLLGTSSGIHGWHSEYYIRRMRVGKNEPLYKYLLKRVPGILEDCYHKPHLEAVISIPQKAPDQAITRNESVFHLLERVKRFNLNWVRPGSIEGDNPHNVSCTISVKDDEWDSVCQWMWDNRDSYNGISVLPFSGGTYKQAPFEECTKEEYEQLLSKCHGIDLTKVVEEDDQTTLNDQVACAGGACEI